MATKAKRTTFVATTMGPREAELYWRSGGLAVTRIAGYDWSITVESHGWSTIAKRFEDPKQAVKAAKAILPLTDWRHTPFHVYQQRLVPLGARVRKTLERGGFIAPKNSEGA